MTKKELTDAEKKALKAKKAKTTVKAKPKKVEKVKLGPDHKDGRPLEAITVCKDENGENGKLVEGYVSPDKKSVTTLEGVTYAL